MPMESSLGPLRALFCALTDERERMRDAQKPVDSFPPVRPQENLLRTLLPAASNVSPLVFLLGRRNITLEKSLNKNLICYFVTF